ncbi:uncharacterized protein Mf isoform X1 [Tribolium castaneum]|uniref:Myofilin n=1 Tax=Tribolium castaneum TaxID=7070 RepID=D2A2S3_TRICA|nr:PREDICTED: uncharacterized protein LOC655573 isoform X1 [Tribolium castaneum]XP_975727.1 PREDICTED: uncharacterized protein LOC655573 isoform X1 [Tribolium castaneum]EFA01468.1 hypothetical protein TcasGA2_TC007015 [Tribolium castaneum]|eukprot:XP_008192416.1 PREDICTED: uncharacterized protein LOC655573 isoform X1 [Tribolium castaneum]
MFKNHLEMIGRNETASKKAKFWQSFVGSLKGSQDIRATDPIHTRPRGIFRPISDLPELGSGWPFGKSIYDDPIHAGERIHVPGYRYDPLHRDTYGYSPRPIYPHNYGSLDRYRPVFHITKPRPFDADKAWQDHIDRVKGREPSQWPSIFHTTYPFSRYPLYLVYSKRPAPAAEKYDPHRAWLDHLDRLAELDKLYPSLWPRWGRSLSPTPIKSGEWGPRPSEVAFNYAGQPIYNRGGLFPSKRLFRDLLNPSPFLPISSIINDPFWWDSPLLRPYSTYNPWGKSPFYLRDSYLSPVKRTYLWDKHPIRPFAAVY